MYFYTLGNMLGIDRIAKWATALGLGDKTGIDIPNEIQSIMPSTEWKRARFGEKWYAGETISVAIGQGAVAVTPMSLATMMMTVANGGTRYTPHVLKAVDEGQGWKLVPPPPPPSVVRMKESTVSAVHDGLWMVVNAAGTGGRGKIVGRDVSGKTGTAQAISSLEHAWRKARWTSAIMAGSSSSPRVTIPNWRASCSPSTPSTGFWRRPIAKHVIETYYAKKEGQPLPVLQKTPAPANVVATAAVSPRPPAVR